MYIYTYIYIYIYIYTYIYSIYRISASPRLRVSGIRALVRRGLGGAARPSGSTVVIIIIIAIIMTIINTLLR